MMILVKKMHDNKKNIEVKKIVASIFAGVLIAVTLFGISLGVVLMAFLIV